MWQDQRITSSAWKRSVGGMVRPRALAVLRLIDIIGDKYILAVC